MKNTARVLSFGKGGHTIYYSGHGTCSGYCDPESFINRDNHSDEVWPSDGVPVVDMRSAVDTKEGWSWVFKGPMLDPDIKDGEVDKCPALEPFHVVAFSGFGSALLAGVSSQLTKERAGALDSVSTKEWVEGWRNHGARVGRCFVKDNQTTIVWEA